MRKLKYRYGKGLLLAVLVAATFGFIGPKLIPEMKAVLDNFADRAKRAAAFQQYGQAGVVPPELTICDMAKPVVAKTEEKEGITYYTLESRVDKCENSPTAAGTVRVFTLGWKNGKIVAFAWEGPKGGKVEY